jgi:hypothetical protein
MSREEIKSLVEDQMKEFQLAVIENFESYADTWLDAVIDHCNTIGMDIEDCATMISPFLVSRMREEGIRRKTLKNDGLIKLD